MIMEDKTVKIYFITLEMGWIEDNNQVWFDKDQARITN